jgi:hypothetical protein
MDLEIARTKAHQLMKKHRLTGKGWSFEFDRAKYRLGLCNHTRKLITVSKHFTGAADEDQFEQALLHEIAHALLPQEAGHGFEWKLKAKQIGYRGTRLAHNPYSAQRRREEAQKVADKVAASRSIE